MHKKQKGFTLVEMLVAIAIVGLLSAVIMVSMSKNKAKARDANRKAAAAELRKAFELYFLDNSKYPSNGPAGTPNQELDIQFLTSFLVPTYLSSMPADPTRNPDNYKYVWKNDGKDYGLYIPFGNEDGGISCQFQTPGGNKNWFGKTPECSY